MHEKVEDFLALLKRVTPDSTPVTKVEVFNFIRSYWAEFGEDIDVAERVCSQLDITRGTFNLWLDAPELIYGIESLHRYIKPGSWLRRYLEYTSGHEAPEEFHLWVGMTILGAALRRNVWFDNIFYKLYPNLYTVLISPPAVCKKSTCIDIGIKILRAAEVPLTIINEKITPEAIFVSLSKARHEKKESGGTLVHTVAHGLFNAPELTVFLGREAYNEGLIILLTRLYDCPDIIEYTTRKDRGALQLKDVFSALLGATTPSEIPKAIPESATGGGFISRVTFVHRDVPTRMFAFPTMSDSTLRELLVAKLAETVSTFSGGFVMSESAIAWYKDFYKKHKESLGGKGPAAERQPDLIIKVAMILSASEAGGLLLDVDILERALKIVLSVEKGIEGTLRMISSSETGRMTESVLNVIKKNGGNIQHKHLLKKLYGKMNGREIALCIDTLREAEIIEKNKGEGGTWYKLKSLD